MGTFVVEDPTLWTQSDWNTVKDLLTDLINEDPLDDAEDVFNHIKEGKILAVVSRDNDEIDMVGTLSIEQYPKGLVLRIGWFASKSNEYLRTRWGEFWRIVLDVSLKFGVKRVELLTKVRSIQNLMRRFNCEERSFFIAEVR